MELEDVLLIIQRTSSVQWMNLSDWMKGGLNSMGERMME